MPFTVAHSDKTVMMCTNIEQVDYSILIIRSVIQLIRELWIRKIKF